MPPGSPDSTALLPGQYWSYKKDIYIVYNKNIYIHYGSTGHIISVKTNYREVNINRLLLYIYYSTALLPEQYWL